MPRCTLRPRHAALALAGLATLAAAGCAQPRSAASQTSLEAIAGAPVALAWSTLQPEAALLRLPDGRDRAVSLRERRAGQAIVQEAVLLPGRGGSGTSLITFAIHGETPPASFYPGVPSEAGIKSEIAAAFPGRAFRIVPQPRRNAYGPYGLAISASQDGQRCIYAWQWLDDDRPMRESLGGAASWRARLCRKAESLDDMAAALDQIAIGPQIGLVAPAPQTRAPHPQPTKAAIVRSSSKPARRASGAPTPAPTTVAASGEPYLAAVPAPLVASGSSTVRTALDQSLPMEAYRGPAVRGGVAPDAGPRERAAPRPIVPAPN